jgi:hypothetical protein
MPELLYGSIDYRDPVIWTSPGPGEEAWIFLSDKWRPYSSVYASAKALLMPEADFKAYFPNLPPVPSAAFTRKQS